MKWYIHFSCPTGTIYAGERYTLAVIFEDTYPFEGPEVLFVGKPPVHEHIYTNGYICLSTLYEWTPNLNVGVLVLSIISMMSSANEKTIPPNNEELTTEYANIRPKAIDWEFEDTRC